MESSDIKDLFSEYKLDWDDPYTESLVQYVSEAVVELYKASIEDKSPSVAFTVFVNAWDYYYFTPQKSQEKSKKLMDAFGQMWVDVSNSEVCEFCELCTTAHRNKETEMSLCKKCSELVEAIFALDGRIPDPQRIFDAAYKAAVHNHSLSPACTAQLYILSARIWYKCMGYSSKEEELMLSEGIRHHFEAKEQKSYPKTELYYLHTATAIYDIVYVRLENGAKREDITWLVNEAYSLLSLIDSPASLKEKMDFYQMTGIPFNDLCNEDYPQFNQVCVGKKSGLLN